MILYSEMRILLSLWWEVTLVLSINTVHNLRQKL